MNSRPTVPIWSAVPTPLAPDLKVDVASVSKMVSAAVSDGIEGLLVAGTCSEGPWLPDRERRRLMQATVQAAAGRLKIAAQVSDDSVPRILDNAAVAAECGVDFAIIAPPATLLNAPSFAASNTCSPATTVSCLAARQRSRRSYGASANFLSRARPRRGP